MKKYIALKEPKASSMIRAFNEVAKNHTPAKHVRIQMNKRAGTNISRSAFARAMRNPVYAEKNIY